MLIADVAETLEDEKTLKITNLNMETTHD
jgi:hypothetical protein